MKTFWIPLTLCPLLGFADVNMRDASFIKTQNETKSPYLARTYNSRSLWKGAFGFGWCADFEKSLEVLSETSGILKSCDRHLKVTLSRAGSHWKTHDPRMGQLTFDSSGKLIRAEKAGQKSVSFQYEGQTLIELRSAAAKYRLSYDSLTGELREIRDFKDFKVTYKYHDENLVEARSSKKVLNTYSYDLFHNLVAINSGGKVDKIAYNSQTDEVLAHFRSNQCFELYQFKKISDLQFQSSIHQRCPSSPVQRKVFSFTAKRSPQGGLVLTEIKTAGGGKNESAILP